MDVGKGCCTCYVNSSIARYKKHPQCRRLVCFVYDPEGRIANPSGIESDLNSGDHGIEVRVFILPKASG